MVSIAIGTNDYAIRYVGEGGLPFYPQLQQRKRGRTLAYHIAPQFFILCCAFVILFIFDSWLELLCPGCVFLHSIKKLQLTH